MAASVYAKIPRSAVCLRTSWPRDAATSLQSYTTPISFSTKTCEPGLINCRVKTSITPLTASPGSKCGSTRTQSCKRLMQQPVTWLSSILDASRVARRLMCCCASGSSRTSTSTAVNADDSSKSSYRSTEELRAIRIQNVERAYPAVLAYTLMATRSPGYTGEIGIERKAPADIQRMCQPSGDDKRAPYH